MQRIKLDVFQSLFNKNLTGKEIDFLIILSFYQDKRGVVQGMHYKKMMDEAGMSAQSFYDCKSSLMEKGVIQAVGVHNDYDITLVGNDFTIYNDEDYKNGRVKYLSTNCRLFRDCNFRCLKPKQKLLVMALYQIQSAGAPNGVQSYRIGREKFFQKYTQLLEISRRTLQKYLKMLKLYFSIGLKEGIYYFTIHKNFTKRAETSRTEKEVAMGQILEAACRRNKVNNPDPKERKEILQTLSYREKDLLKYFVDVSGIIRQMVAVINAAVLNPRKWKRRLKSSLFTKLFNESIA